MQASDAKNFVIKSLFPANCYGCKRKGTYLCSDCFEITNYFPHSICPHCRQALPLGKLPDICKDDIGLDRLFSCVDYSDVRIKHLIKDLKYKYAAALATPLSEFVYWWLARNEYIDELKNNIDLIIPVPIHKSKFKKRGFNHAASIAQHLGMLLDIPVADNLLIKIKKTKPQIETEDKDERQKNVTNAFELNTSTIGVLGTPIVSKKILLIDDVITTGSTLNECAKALRRNGTTEIWALTIAQD